MGSSLSAVADSYGPRGAVRHRPPPSPTVGRGHGPTGGEGPAPNDVSGAGPSPGGSLGAAVTWWSAARPGRLAHHRYHRERWPLGVVERTKKPSSQMTNRAMAIHDSILTAKPAPNRRRASSRTKRVEQEP